MNDTPKRFKCDKLPFRTGELFEVSVSELKGLLGIGKMLNKPVLHVKDAQIEHLGMKYGSIYEVHAVIDGKILYIHFKKTGDDPDGKKQ